jgi:hypothetical protein
MNQRTELEDLLPAARRLPTDRLQGRRRHLVAEIENKEGPSWFRRFKWSLAAGVGALAIGGGVAASGVLDGGSVREFAGIDCFGEPNVGANRVLVNASADPIQACAEAWSQGRVIEGGATPAQLAACVLEEGHVGVFPGGPETCEQLGLAALPGDYVEQFASWEEASEAAFNRIGHAGCVGAEEARSIVQEEFAARGIDDWTVQIDESAPPVPAPAPNGCVGVVFDGAAKIVILIPDAGG